MCGLFGLVRSTQCAHPEPASGVFLDLGRLAERRGRDAAGFALVQPRQPVAVVKATRPFGDFWQPQHRRLLRQARVALGHTRHASQGAPGRLANAHPLEVGSLVGTVNGDIDADDLRDRLPAGLPAAQGETDSEILLLALNRVRGDLGAVCEVLAAVRGPAWPSSLAGHCAPLPSPRTPTGTCTGGRLRRGFTAWTSEPTGGWASRSSGSGKAPSWSSPPTGQAPRSSPSGRSRRPPGLATSSASRSGQGLTPARWPCSRPRPVIALPRRQTSPTSPPTAKTWPPPPLDRAHGAIPKGPRQCDTLDSSPSRPWSSPVPPSRWRSTPTTPPRCPDLTRPVPTGPRPDVCTCTSAPRHRGRSSA